MKGMDATLEHLIQLAKCLEKQFGSGCEIVIHDLSRNPEHTIAHISNGDVTGRMMGGGSSKIVLAALEANKSGKVLRDHLGYLTKTSDGRFLKSSTMYIRDKAVKTGQNTIKGGKISYIFSINYDITAFMTSEIAIKNLIRTGYNAKKKPDTIERTVGDLLDDLIDESVRLIGKPAHAMNREEKKTAIEHLNKAGAFLITKSSEKVAEYFGISKFTLYNYIDINKN